MQLIFSHVLYLLGTSNLSISDVFKYDLSPVPTSMFSESGEARYTNSKSVLMNKLKCEVPKKDIVPSVTVLDGMGMLHSSIYWPKNGMMKDLVDGVDLYIQRLISDSNVYLVFDRYLETSIKSDTRTSRVSGFQVSHQLNFSSDLPPKDICMASMKTKECIIEVITKELIE